MSGIDGDGRMTDTGPPGRRCPVCEGTVTDQYRVYNSMEPGTLFRCGSCHRYFRTILRECREDEV